MEFQIESNIPTPEIKQHYSKYPVSKLEVGQSFFVGDSTLFNSLYQIASRKGRAEKKKFLVRKVAGGGLRCWRVK